MTNLRCTHFRHICMFVLLGFSFFLSGCATHRELVRLDLWDANKGYIGRPVDTLLLSKGSPDSKADLQTGEQVWTYRRTKTGPPHPKALFDWSVPRDDMAVTWVENLVFVVGQDHVVHDVRISVE